MKILALDPSGNFNEGKGTTGWAEYYNNKLTAVGQIRALDYKSQEEYWKAHVHLLEATKPNVCVIENYRLFASAKDAQVNSELETPQLIGVIKMYCSQHDIVTRMQPPQIKTRFNNKILLHKNIVSQDVQKRYYAVGIPISRHILDAIRHGEYYINFKLKKENFNESSN